MNYGNQFTPQSPFDPMGMPPDQPKADPLEKTRKDSLKTCEHDIFDGSTPARRRPYSHPNSDQYETYSAADIARANQQRLKQMLLPKGKAEISSYHSISTEKSRPSKTNVQESTSKALNMKLTANDKRKPIDALLRSCPAPREHILFIKFPVLQRAAFRLFQFFISHFLKESTR